MEINNELFKVKPSIVERILLLPDDDAKMILGIVAGFVQAVVSNGGSEYRKGSEEILGYIDNVLVVYAYASIEPKKETWQEKLIRRIL